MPITYWIPKHKNPVGSLLIIASKNCSTKPLSKAVSNVIKLIYSKTENLNHKSKFLSNYNKFWVLQNVNPVIENINIISKLDEIYYLTYDTLSAVLSFYYIYFWRMTPCHRYFFFFLDFFRHDSPWADTFFLAPLVGQKMIWNFSNLRVSTFHESMMGCLNR